MILTNESYSNVKKKSTTRFSSRFRRKLNFFRFFVNLFENFFHFFVKFVHDFVNANHDWFVKIWTIKSNVILFIIMKTNDRDVIVMSMKNNDDSWFESENHSRSVSKNDDDHEFDRSDNCRSACLSDAFSFKSNDDLQIVSLKVVQFLKKNAQVLQRIVLFLMNNKRVSKTLYNLVLKIEELRLKKEIENVDETTKIRKKLVESLMRLHAKSFEFATSIVSRIAILVNVTKKDQNLFRDFEVIEFFFAINVDVIRSIIENAINDENDIMLRNKIMIDIDEQTILNFQQSIEKCEIFVFFLWIYSKTTICWIFCYRCWIR